MRDHLEAYIAAGGNAAFFSGNSVCWRVRSEDEGRALVCWKQQFNMDPAYAAGDYANLSTLWSHHLVGRPENELTGVGFLYGGYHLSHGQYMDGSGAFTVHPPRTLGFRRERACNATPPSEASTPSSATSATAASSRWKTGLPVTQMNLWHPSGLYHLVHRPCAMAPRRQRVVRALGKGPGGRGGHGPLYSRRHSVHSRDNRLVAWAKRRRNRRPDHPQRPRPTEPDNNDVTPL